MRSAELQNQCCSSKITDEEELYQLILLFLGEVSGDCVIQESITQEVPIIKEPGLVILTPSCQLTIKA